MLCALITNSDTLGRAMGQKQNGWHEQNIFHAAGAALFILSRALLGCAQNPDEQARAPSPCDALIDTCLVDQKTCVADAQGPRCEVCAPGSYASKNGQCNEIGGTATSHDFEEFTVEAGEEISGLCQSWTLNNAEELWVNAVELEQNAASHHSNWTYVPADQFSGPDGVWPCKDRNYSQLNAALYGGVLYAQSTQAPKEVQKFPDGAAIRIMPYARVISDIHLLNPKAEAVTGHVKLSIYSIPKEQVAVKLVPFHMVYSGLDIPAMASSRFTGDCELKSLFPADILNLKVYYILPHTHAMATRFFLEAVGGSIDKTSLIDIEGFNGEARGRLYDPPVDLSPATGLRFACEYNNTRSVNVNYGIGDQEMCEFLGFAEGNSAFESVISTAAEVGAEGSRRLFSGPCNTTVFPWTHDKAGGPPP